MLKENEQLTKPQAPRHCQTNGSETKTLSRKRDSNAPRLQFI